LAHFGFAWVLIWKACCVIGFNGIWRRKHVEVLLMTVPSAVVRPQQPVQPSKKTGNLQSTVRFGMNDSPNVPPSTANSAGQSADVKDESQKSMFEKAADKLKEIGQSIADKVGESINKFITSIKDKVVGVVEKGLNWVGNKVHSVIDRLGSFFGGGEHQQQEAASVSSTARVEPSTTSGTAGNSAV
jgi:prophage DNA circulation protein